MTAASDREEAARQPRAITLRLVLLLYVATISLDAVRKVVGRSANIDIVVYLIVSVMYLFLIPGIGSRLRATPRYLPVWLTMLTGWCVIEAVVPRIPLGMAALGWVSYVFFVPLVYIGAELMATDRSAARALRIVAIMGGVIGLGAAASALLGPSAPPILLPIVPSVGVHSYATGNIYLAPSVFATAEEAAEELLVALFAWIALAHLPSGRLGRAASGALGTLIAVGLFATQRRADIVVAIIGITALVIPGLLTPRGQAGRLIPRASRARSRTGPALILGVVGSIALLSFLGASKVVPFLTSGADGQSALARMFSPPHPGSLTGQGTGTSTQGASIVGATSFTGIRDHRYYIGYAVGGESFFTAEGGIAKTWLELGVMGVVLYAGVIWSVLGPAVRALRHLDDVGRALTVLTLALGIVFLKGHQSLDDPLIQPLFWLCAGGVWGRWHARGATPLQEAGRAEEAASADGHSRARAPQIPLR